jgi:gliding motility-associated-like protein
VKYKHILALLFALLFARANAQVVGVPNNQDCIDAIPVCQNTFNQPNSYVGTGNVLNEINPLTSCLLTGEKNDVWYTFTVQTSGNLNFSITPNDTLDDYDWQLFNLTNNSCSDIYNDSSLSTSCNYSSNLGCGGVTGANGQNNGPCGGQDNPVVPVVAGQVYVLNVSNFSSTQFGYLLDFSQSTAQIFDTTKPRLQSITSMHCMGDSLNVVFSKNIVCSSVQTTDFSFTGPGGAYTISSVTSPACLAGLPYSRAYSIVISPPITLPGTYTLHLVGPVTDVCGNVAIFPAALSFTIDPIVIVRDTVIMHCNQNNSTIALTVTGGVAPVVYKWSPNTSTGDSAINMTPGTYTVQITDINNCKVTGTYKVRPSPPMSLSLTPNDSLCMGGSVVVTATAAGGVQPYSYSWNHGLPDQPSQTVNSTVTTTYVVAVTDSNHCKLGPDSMKVFVTGAPLAVITEDITKGCSPLKVTFIATAAGNTPGCIYSWTFGDGTTATGQTQIHDYTTPGCHNVTLTVTPPSHQCSTTKTDTCLINVFPVPEAAFVANPTVTDILSPLVNFTDQSTGATSWSWTFGDSAAASIIQNPDHSYPVPGLYPVTLIVKDSSGCVDSMVVNILVKDVTSFYVPNAFTPNGDGLNDAFGPKGFRIDLTSFDMMIFDRWGNLVYETKDFANQWNGSLNNSGKPAPEDVYVYSIEFKDDTNQRYKYVGRVTLVR